MPANPVTDAEALTLAQWERAMQISMIGSAMALLFLIPAPVHGAPAPARQVQLEHLLTQDCGACHGLHLTGGLGPALTPQALSGQTRDSLIATVTYGRPALAMPGWAPLLNAGDIAWNPRAMIRPLLACIAGLLLTACSQPPLRGSGDLGLVVERASGSLLIIDSSHQARLARVEGLGDLSHASAVFSRDQRYAYLFGRDGGLTKVDLLTQRIDKRLIQGGNSIGGAISQDGRLIAVSNYQPGGVKVFDAVTLQQVADIPATPLADGKRSRVVGLVDAPGQRFVF
eukprot:gene2611-3388_t